MNPASPFLLSRYSLLSAYLLAGFSALAYQIISFKLIAVSGLSDAMSVAISLTAFVVLSGLGSLYARRVSPRLAWIPETLLGAYSAAIFLFIELFSTEALLVLSGSFSVESKLILYLALVAPMAFIPGILMPIYHRRAQASLPGNESASFGAIYVVFHAGGALSLLLIELYVFPSKGWSFAGIAVSLLSLVNGLLSRSFDMPVAGAASPSVGAPSSSIDKAKLFLISVLTGFVGILVYKAFDYIVGPNIRNYTAVTASIFLGIALSGLVTYRTSLKMNSMGLLVSVVSILALLILASAPYATIPLVFAGLSPWVVYALVLAAIVIPLYAVYGTSVTVAVRDGMRSDTALFLSSIGNGVGYWLYLLSAGQLIDVFIVALLAIGVFFACLKAHRIALVLPFAALVGLTASQVPQLALHQAIIAANMEAESHVGAKIFAIDEVPIAFDSGRVQFDGSWNPWGWSTDAVSYDISYTQADFETQYSQSLLVIGGFISLNLDYPEMLKYSESAAALIPSMFVENKGASLVLGAGTGVSAGAVADLYSRSEVVDLNPETLSALEYFSELNNDLKSKSTLHERDALSFVAEAAVSGRSYDLIFSTVTGPGLSYSSMLYTKEFYQQVSRSLAPNGVFAFWLDGRLGLERGAPEVLNALQSSFDHTRFFSVRPTMAPEGEMPYVVILASNDPLRLRTDTTSKEFQKLTQLMADLSDIEEYQTAPSSPQEYLKGLELHLCSESSARPGSMRTLSFSYDYEIMLESRANMYKFISKDWSEDQDPPQRRFCIY